MFDSSSPHGYSQQTIRETLRICGDKGILTEYIKKRENEIMDIMSYLFDQENVTRLYGLEQRKKGVQEGRKEGRIEGEKSGIEKSKQEIARNMLRTRATMDYIHEITGLSKAAIRKLKKEMIAEGALES